MQVKFSQNSGRHARWLLAPMMGMMIMVTMAGSVSVARAQSVSIEIFASRIEALEEGLKDVRGVLEEDLRALRQQIDGKGDIDQGRIEALENQLGKLIDQMRMLNSRLERTLEVTSDNEFRLLRMEKRIESLMRMGIEGDLANAAQAQSQPAAGQTPPATGAGDVPASSLNAQQDTSAGWTIEASKLEEEMQKPAAADQQADTAPEPKAGEAINAGKEAAIAPKPQPEVKSVLPDAAPEEQYRFALGKALQSDLDTAEEAFREFVAANKEHDRLADATFWLGRVQFMKGSFEAAAMTFTEFNTVWPTDSRVEKTTLWIAEAVSTFASKPEVCELLEQLPTLVENPTDSFFDRLGKLKTKSECTS